MMPMFTQILSIVIGFFLGILYGFLFVGSKKEIFSAKLTDRKNLIFSFSVSVLRIVIISLLFFYLLRLPAIRFILLLPSFLIGFWLIVLKERPKKNEGS